METIPLCPVMYIVIRSLRGSNEYNGALTVDYGMTMR